MKIAKVVLSKAEVLTKEEVKKLIATNDNAVMKAALVIYRQQTSEEQSLGYSNENNYKGFNRYDAPELSAFAAGIELNKGAYKKDINKYRYRLMKYAQQIADITNDKRDIQYEWEFKK